VKLIERHLELEALAGVLDRARSGNGSGIATSGEPGAGKSALVEVACADRIRRTLRQRGVMQLPPRPRSTTRTNPAGLTNRQLDVAQLVARGLTNAEIATLPHLRDPEETR
jgi:DNA-binding NarL/FixJ family response regulator